MDQVGGMISLAFGSCLSWFGEILLSSQASGVYLGCVAVFLTYRFLLAPVFGAVQSAGASDYVKRHRKKSKDKSSKKGN